MPNLARGVSPGRAPSKPPPKLPAKAPSWGPLKSGYVPSTPKSQPSFSPKLQKTFAPLGKQVGAPSKLGNKAAQERGSQTGRSLFGTIGHAISSGIESAYPHGKSHADIQKIQQSRARQGLPGATISSPSITAAEGGISQKWQDIGLAFAKNPSGTFGHTVSSIVPAANALLTGTGRIVAETATGHPKALLAIPKGLAQEAKEEYGSKNRAQDIAKIEHHGALNPILDTTMVLGGAASAAGRGISSVIRASGRGADAFAKTQAYRDALNSALKAPATADHVRAQQEARLGEYRAGNVTGSAPQAANVESALAKHAPSDLPPKPTAYERRLAAKFESTQPRPNLRSATGREPVSIKPGAAVTTQTRSPNYFRARVQTAIDNARRRLQTADLEKVARIRQEAANNPHIAGARLDRPYAHQLTYDTMRGEVMPLMQRHGSIGQFLGAARAQRIGASRIIGGEQTLKGRLSHGYGRDSEKALRSLNEPQRKLLVLAKEGHIALDDPQRALSWLQEVHDQAVEGSAGLRLGIQHIAKGSDVARETGAVLDHIKKNGPESVFTAKFQRAVELPGHISEGAVGYHGTNAHPDEIIAEGGLRRQGYLAENPKHAGTYVSDGGFLYKVNRAGLKTSGSGSEIKLEDRAPATHVSMEPRTGITLSHGDLQAIKGKIPDRLFKELDNSQSNKIVAAADARVLAKVLPNEFQRRDLQQWVAAYEKHGTRPLIPGGPTSGIPDERLVSGRNPVLDKDRATARRYLPQMHMLAEWARRHPEHPDAAATAQGVTQIHQLNERGFDLRQAAKGRGKLPHEPEGQRAIAAEAALERARVGLKRANSGPPNRAGVVAAERTLKNAKAEFVASQKELTALKKNKDELHARADEKLTTAKNLADEVARSHGLPTDRAYIPHVLTLQDARGTGEAAYSPADYKRWEGTLQAHGTRSTDHTLVMRGIEQSLRDEHNMRIVNALEKRFAVQLPRKDMTVREVDKWLADTGKNPKDFARIHFGKLRQDIQEGANADHLAHLNLDETDHARLLEHAVKKAAEAGDTRGTSLIPRAAFHEIQAQLKQSKAPFRGFGKLKGSISKLMLDTSLPWATTMHLTYAIQSLMGGAGPIDFASHVKYYRKLSTEDKARFDHAFGVDSPYHVSTHGIEPEGTWIPNSLQGLAERMRVMRNSPQGRFLAKGNPLAAVLRFERNPRRLSRINLAMKGVKHQAIREMGSDLHNIQSGMNAFEQGTRRLMHVGRLPAEEYMKKAFANTEAMEKVAQHVVHVMGEWHNSTAFEKNVLNRMIMFYPWVRYSLKLMAHTLPTRHPLMLAAALKLGELEHHELVELLGTEPELGAVYLGAAQPNVPAKQRKFEQFGIKQANPIINTLTEASSPATGGNIGQLLSALPPYITSAIGYAVGKSLFTDKPLTGAKLGEAQQVKGRPGVLGYAEHELEQMFTPTRIAGHQLTSGRAQASESAPVAGLLGIGPGTKYREYGKKYERKIAKEPHSKALLPELFPFIPHPAEHLPQTIERTTKEQKAEKKLAKKQARRDKKDAWPTGPGTTSEQTKDAWPTP